MLFLLRNWRSILTALAVFLLAGAVSWYGATKYRAGEKAAQEACNREKMHSIERAIEIEHNQKNVIRPDDRAYIDLLRRGGL